MEMQTAIAMSLQENGMSQEMALSEPARRREGVPVGLRNSANTCYLNSLLQTYLALPMFADKVMKFDPKSAVPVADPKVEARRKAAVELVISLQKVFAYMACSSRAFIDPINVLDSLVDDEGNKVLIGEQKDAGEFNSIFLFRINDALELHPAAGRNLEDPPAKTSFVYNTFFGRCQIVRRAREKDGSAIDLTSESTFGPVLVSATERDVYDGWDANNFTVIEEYQTPKGFLTRAEQEYWITRAPNVLFMQIQRVVFDKEAKAPRKVFNPVHFYKTIYIDRYMLKNRRTSTTIRSKVLTCRRNIRALRAALEKFQSYGHGKSSIQNSLKSTVEFLNENRGFGTGAVSPQELPSPNMLGTFGHDRKTVDSAITLLSEYEITVSQHVRQLEKRIAELETIISHAYDSLRQHEYVLHSILVHAGQADSGHYYSFIYDFELLKWRKYSDTNITDVSEETVFKESLGEINKSAQAYFLVYVAAGCPLSEARLFIPPTLHSEVTADNLALDLEIQERHATETAMRIKATHIARCELLPGLRADKRLQPEYPMLNLACFLEESKDPLFRWQLLDTCLREFTDNKMSLERTWPEDILYQKLLKSPFRQKPESLELSPAEKTRLATAKEIYMLLLRNYVVIKFTLSAILSQDWAAATNGMLGHIAHGMGSEGSAQEFMLKVAKILVLRLCTATSESLMRRDIGGAVTISGMVATMCFHCIEAESSHVSHAAVFLSWVFAESDAFLAEAQKSEVSSNLQLISTSPRPQPGKNLPPLSDVLTLSYPVVGLREVCCRGHRQVPDLRLA